LITGSKPVEEVLQEYEKVVESSDELIAVIDREYHYRLANRAYVNHLGLKPEDVMGSPVSQVLGRDFFEKVVKEKLEACFQGKVVRYEEKYSYPHLGERDLLVSYFPIDGHHGVDRAACVIQDITDRKRAELELRRLNRAYQTLSGCNQAIVRATAEGDLLEQICRILVSAGGYRMAWVGYGQDNEGKSVLPMAHAGFEEGYLQAVGITWADTERGRGPTGTAIRTGKPVVARNVQTDPSLTPWREEQIKHGYASTIALPITLGDNVPGALTVYAGEPDAFDLEEVQLLTELANDLAYGIQAVRTRANRQRAEEALVESQALTNAIVESTSDLIWSVDSESFKLLTFNRNLADYFLQWCQIRLQVGTGPEDHFPTEELVNRWRELYNRALSEGTYTTEYHVTAGPTILQLTFNLLKRDGKVFGISVSGKDVTESKRAEEALVESEARFRGLVENATVGIYRTTPEGRIVMANAALARMLGCENFDQLVVRNLEKEGFEPDYPRRAFRERLERDGEVRGLEAAWTRQDGSVIFVRESARAVRGESGEVLYYDGIVEDITTRKRAEEELIKERYLLHTLMDNLPDVIYFKDLESRFTRINLALAKEFGLTHPSQAVGKTDFDFFTPEHAKDAYRDEQEIIRTGQPVVGKEEVETWPDGRVTWASTTKMPLRDAQGNIVGSFGVSRDITERKRAEAEHAQLITAIEQSADGVLITNTRGEIEYVNPAFTRTTGYSREEVLGQTPRMLKSGLQEPAFYQQLWSTILQGENWRGEVVNRRKGGGLYTEELNIAPVRNPRGEITHFIATIHDVTEHKSLEAQLQQKAKMEAVGRLAGGVAHDFNNLLTVINGYAEILKDEFASDTKSSAYLKEIFGAGERAASLTRQLLAFSRRQVLAPQILDLNEVVSNLEKMLRRLIGEDIKLHTLLHPSLGRVKADPGQVEQIIMNLVVNARDAMPLGGNLTIGTANVELSEDYARSHPTVKPGPHVMLAVGDTGIGMTPETQAHIFEPFFTTKERGEGTGLGLSTVYGIVKQSGGSIWVYSEPGQGSVFKIYLPTVSESRSAVAPPKKELHPALGTETILVVEDEGGVRSLIELALASSGYKVLTTAEPESALAVCAKHDGPIHLLLTDVIMPKMSGPVMAEKVAALRPGIKVLYMSGYTDDAIVHHGVLTQEMPFIQKPFSPLALRKKIREVLG
jgi:PAS domain S-box-containing protein